MTTSLTELSNAENAAFIRDRPRMSNTEMRLGVFAAVLVDVEDNDEAGCFLVGDATLS